MNDIPKSDLKECNPKLQTKKRPRIVRMAKLERKEQMMRRRREMRRRSEWGSRYVNNK